MLHLILALQANLLLAAVALALRLPGALGVAACVPVGLAVMHYAGTEGYALLAAYAAIGVLVGLGERIAHAAEPRAPQAAHSALSVGNVIAGCVPPVVLAVFWDSLPDPAPCHAAVTAGFGAIAGNAASRGFAAFAPRPDRGACSIRPTVGGTVIATAGGCVVALAGCAAGGILLAHIWAVIAAVAGANLCFSLIALIARRNAGPAIWAANLVSATAACAAAGALTWAAR